MQDFVLKLASTLWSGISQTLAHPANHWSQIWSSTFGMTQSATQVSRAVPHLRDPLSCPAWETSRVRNSACTSCQTFSRSISSGLHLQSSCALLIVSLTRENHPMMFTVSVPICSVVLRVSGRKILSGVRMGPERPLEGFVVFGPRFRRGIETLGGVRSQNQEEGWNVFWREKFRVEGGRFKVWARDSEPRERVLKLSFLRPTDASWCFFFLFVICFLWSVFVVTICDRYVSCNLFFLWFCFFACCFCDVRSDVVSFYCETKLSRQFDKTTFLRTKFARALMPVRQIEKQMREVMLVFEDKFSE